MTADPQQSPAETLPPDDGGADRALINACLGAAVVGSIPVVVAALGESDSPWLPPASDEAAAMIVIWSLLTAFFWLNAWLLPVILAGRRAVEGWFRTGIHRGLAASLVGIAVAVFGLIIGQSLRIDGFQEHGVRSRLGMLIAQCVLFVFTWNALYENTRQPAKLGPTDTLQRGRWYARLTSVIALVMLGGFSLGVSAIAGCAAWEPRSAWLARSVVSPDSSLQVCVVVPDGPWHLFEYRTSLEVLPANQVWRIGQRGTLVWTGHDLGLDDIRWTTRDTVLIRVRALYSEPSVRTWRRVGVSVRTEIVER